MFDFTEKREYKGPMDPFEKAQIIKRVEERLIRNNKNNLFIGFGVIEILKPVDEVVANLNEVLVKLETPKKKVARTKKEKVVEKPLELVEIPRPKVEFIAYESIFDIALRDAERTNGTH